MAALHFLNRPPLSFFSWSWLNPSCVLMEPSHLGKSCYIRGGCVPMNTFDATDYESALRFFSFLKLPSFGKKFIWNFEELLTMWRHFKYLRIVTKFRGSYCDCNTITNQAGIVMGMNKHFIQGSPINRYAESSCGWGVWRFNWPCMV